MEKTCDVGTSLKATCLQSKYLTPLYDRLLMIYIRYMRAVLPAKKSGQVVKETIKANPSVEYAAAPQPTHNSQLTHYKADCT